MGRFFCCNLASPGPFFSSQSWSLCLRTIATPPRQRDSPVRLPSPSKHFLPGSPFPFCQTFFPHLLFFSVSFPSSSLINAALIAPPLCYDLHLSRTDPSIHLSQHYLHCSFYLGEQSPGPPAPHRGSDLALSISSPPDGAPLSTITTKDYLRELESFLVGLNSPPSPERLNAPPSPPLFSLLRSFLPALLHLDGSAVLYLCSPIRVHPDAIFPKWCCRPRCPTRGQSEFLNRFPA